MEFTATAGHWLAARWEEALRKVLETFGAAQAVSEARIVPGEAAVWQGWISPAWSRLAPDKIAGAALVVGCPQPTVRALAGLLAGDPALPEEDCVPTYLELLSQIATGAGDSISARLGKRVSFSSPEPASLPAALGHAVQLEFLLEGAPHSIALILDEALAAALGPPADPAPSAVAAPPRAPSTSSAPTTPAGNLDLLLEVELPVSITFGRTQLALKDVLKLSSGSIVELNRLANEPVEVVINNIVVARGEVVVVEGNYGVRISEIISRQERIRSIL